MRPSEINVERVAPDMIALTIDGVEHILRTEEVEAMCGRLGFFNDRPGTPVVGYRPSAIPEANEHEIRRYLEGEKIQAIKDFRDRTNSEIREAKEAVEDGVAEYQRTNPENDPDYDPEYGWYCEDCGSHHH